MAAKVVTAEPHGTGCFLIGPAVRAGLLLPRWVAPTPLPGTPWHTLAHQSRGSLSWDETVLHGGEGGLAVAPGGLPFPLVRTRGGLGGSRGGPWEDGGLWAWEAFVNVSPQLPRPDLQALPPT